MSDLHSGGGEATLENLFRIFTVPEAPRSTLARIEAQISSDLHEFLRENIVANDRPLADIERAFMDPQIPETPWFVSDQTDFLLREVVAESVHTASPRFVGHMTTALPYFMLPLSKLMVALNQNLVKTETAKAMTPLERQVLGMLHHLVYQRDDGFYARYIQNSSFALGAFCSGGTIANLTALWVARNQAFAACGDFAGIGEVGLAEALVQRGYRGAAVVVSGLGHYSLSKSADILGLGRRAIVPAPMDARGRVDPAELRRVCRNLQQQSICVLAIVGVAGTTETGSIDPLPAMADVATEFGAHFHVDAAWGGPTLFSRRWRPLLAGIERADSVTLDAHKQLYVPMGAGMVLFADPAASSAIEHHARYIIREGSRDLGARTLEGSRAGMAMLVHSALRIVSRRGYELLIDRGIDHARWFAEQIELAPDFELISKPCLNILTYRLVPSDFVARSKRLGPESLAAANAALNEITCEIQRRQREGGRTFVSRTRLEPDRYGGQSIDVFRVVLANPLTDRAALELVLAEQREIAKSAPVRAVLTRLAQTLADHEAAIGS